MNLSIITKVANLLLIGLLFSSDSFSFQHPLLGFIPDELSVTRIEPVNRQNYWDRDDRSRKKYTIKLSPSKSGDKQIQVTIISENLKDVLTTIPTEPFCSIVDLDPVKKLRMFLAILMNVLLHPDEPHTNQIIQIDPIAEHTAASIFVSQNALSEESSQTLTSIIVNASVDHQNDTLTVSLPGPATGVQTIFIVENIHEIEQGVPPVEGGGAVASEFHDEVVIKLVNKISNAIKNIKAFNLMFPLRRVYNVNEKLACRVFLVLMSIIDGSNKNLPVIIQGISIEYRPNLKVARIRGENSDGKKVFIDVSLGEAQNTEISITIHYDVCDDEGEETFDIIQDHVQVDLGGGDFGVYYRALRTYFER